ncbi:unnamed protein product [Bemisia tabaci]|uniref:Uncharacterized protein n=1 Tax=Bemisia tabaci TaxID=7038 RepID=A0A9P0F6W3_BEMTA|nr:unnamed protein product [Bemisia tabaci]
MRKRWIIFSQKVQNDPTYFIGGSEDVGRTMLDRLVALQLLLCYWLATVLPPPSIFGYASTLSPDQSYNLHQSLAKADQSGNGIVRRKQVGGRGGGGGLW